MNNLLSLKKNLLIRFARFNTIITSLKALDEGFYRRNMLEVFRASTSSMESKGSRRLEKSKDFDDEDYAYGSKEALKRYLDEMVCLRTCLEQDEWIKDSGCSKHMTGNKSLFSTYKAYDGVIIEYLVKMDDPNITMAEYIRLEEEKARRRGKVYNWETAMYAKICPQHIDEFNLKDETSLSECDEEEQNVICFNDLFPFNVIYPDDSKSDKDNDDDKIDIKQPSRGNVINTDNGAYAQGLNKLLETSHDKSNKIFKTETFIKELNVDIMTWNHLNKRMSFIFLIKNLYVPFGIPFDPKLFYKDEIKLGQV
ncbi:hypothetical protein Tco_1430885 [Tanacetum coccineum]